MWKALINTPGTRANGQVLGLEGNVSLLRNEATGVTKSAHISGTKLCPHHPGGGAMFLLVYAPGVKVIPALNRVCSGEECRPNPFTCEAK